MTVPEKSVTNTLYQYFWKIGEIKQVKEVMKIDVNRAD